MTCDELRERLVDPASSGQGGHAAVVEHLNSCTSCRTATRLYGQIERLFTPDSAGDPPTDFDHRVMAVIEEAVPASGKGGKIPPMAIAAGAVGLLLIALVIFGMSRKRAPAPPRPAPSAATASTQPTPQPRPTDAGPADIERVGNVPVPLDLPPLSPEEEKRASELFDTPFLNSIETLAGLDAFFADDVEVKGLYGPFLPRPAVPAVRPTEKEDVRTKRLYEWRRMPKADRARIEALDKEFRERPEDQRQIILRRWDIVSVFSPEEQAGLRRLAARIAELDPRSLERLKLEMRTVALAPLGSRAGQWNELSFAKTLTGQEREIGRRLLLAR